MISAATGSTLTRLLISLKPEVLLLIDDESMLQNGSFFCLQRLILQIQRVEPLIRNCLSRAIKGCP
jgi:hypothetical protein